METETKIWSEFTYGEKPWQNKYLREKKEIDPKEQDCECHSQGSE